MTAASVKVIGGALLPDAELAQTATLGEVVVMVKVGPLYENTTLVVPPQILLARTRQKICWLVGNATGDTRLVPVTVWLKKVVANDAEEEASTR